MHRNRRFGRRQVSWIFVSALMVATACGGTSKVSSAGSPAPTSASVSPSPAATGYAISLTLSGGQSGTATQAQPDANNACAAGNIDAGIVFNGQTWSLDARASDYHGPGQYSAPVDFALTLSTPSYDIWMSTGGSATYTSSTSLSVEVDMTNMMAGPGEPGANAHLSGTVSCR